jgi:hypothetical protein
MKAMSDPVARALGYPSTTMGWWSIALELVFLLAMGGLILLLAADPAAELPFLSNPLLAVVWFLAGGAGAAVAATAVLAITRGERSMHDFLSLALGTTVLYLALGALVQRA